MGRALFILILLNLTLSFDLALGSPLLESSTDFNVCKPLDFQNRDDCLLRISSKINDNLPEKQTKIIWSSGLSISQGMFVDSEDFTNLGQWFSTTITPSLNVQSSGGYSVNLDIPLSNFHGTGINDSGIFAVGRPELEGLMPIVWNDYTTLLWGVAFRPPLYSGESDGATIDYQSYYQIWEFSALTKLKTSLGNNYFLNFQTKVSYDSDYLYHTVTAAGIYQEDFSQRPVMSYTSLGISKKFSQSELSFSYYADYDLTRGREVYTGNFAKYTVDWDPIELNGLELSWKKPLSPSFLFNLSLLKGLKFYTSLPVEVRDVYFDDLTRAAYVAITADLSYHF